MNHSELTTDQVELSLTLFQTQNGERLLSDFTDVDPAHTHLKIKDLEISSKSFFLRYLVDNIRSRQRFSNILPKTVEIQHFPNLRLYIS